MSMPTGAPGWWKRASTMMWSSGAGLGVLIVAVVLSLSQASSGPSDRTLSQPSTIPLGEVTGVASPCVGVTTLAAFELLPVHVKLLMGSETVSSEIVTGDHRFLLAAPPGRYVITSDQYQRPTGFSVMLRPNQTVQVNLPVACK